MPVLLPVANYRYVTVQRNRCKPPALSTARAETGYQHL